jgi:formylglycine-generating enzyme required for sulfatase activity
MNWPTSQDYNEAIQNASSSFADPGLKSGAVMLNSLGLPVPRSGNFADVYQFNGGDGKMWAVKCFTRKVDGLQKRYLKIDEHLTKAKLPFTVGFKFFEQGIRIRGQWFPLLKMEWVEGFTLNEFVRDNAGKPQYLHALVQMWGKLTARLRDADFAHADLQHGNVLLVAGDAQHKLGLKLIDYDGMWVPALAETHSGEIGHPNFQHPLRLKNRLYNADVDRIPHLVVACALRATMIGGRALWDKFDNGDNLLFKEPDLRDPQGAPVFTELWNLRDDVLCTLVGTIALSSREPLRKTPWLDDLLLMDGGPRLTDDDEKKVIEMLGVGPHFTGSKTAAALHAPVKEEFGDFNFSDDPTDEKPTARPQATRTARKPAADAKKEPKKSRLPYYVGGGVLAVCLIGGIIAITAGGGKKEAQTPQELARHDVNDNKSPESIPPGKKDVTKARANDPKKALPDAFKKTDVAKASGNDPKEVSVGAGKETTPPGDNKIAESDDNVRKPGEVAGVEIATELTMKFCWVPPGEAQLGSSAEERRKVSTYSPESAGADWLSSEAEELRGKFKTNGFWLGKFAVTQKEWESLMAANPSYFSNAGRGRTRVAGLDTSRFPVEELSWEACQEFVKRLNATAKGPGALGKGKFVLPHEDQWEYACRGGKGNKQAYYFGDELNGKEANCRSDYPYGTTIKGPWLRRTTEVGSYEEAAPHPWGLCDMAGNVFQWCDSKNAPILRGGSWIFGAWSSRSACRRWPVPTNFGYAGCRVAFIPD